MTSLSLRLAVVLVPCVAASLVVTSPLLSKTGLGARDAALVLRGTDSQNLAPFKLSKASNIVWRCPSCSGQNFVFATGQDIPVNALGRPTARATSTRAATRVCR